MKSHNHKPEWVTSIELPVGGLIGLFLVMFFVIGEMARGSLSAETGYLFLGGLFVLNVALVTWFVRALTAEPAPEPAVVYLDLPSSVNRRRAR
jgi:hypothetical protein